MNISIDGIIQDHNNITIWAHYLRNSRTSISVKKSKESIFQVCEELLNNLYNSKEISSLPMEHHKVQAAKEDIQKIIFNNNFEITTIAELLQNKQWDEQKIKCFVSLLENKKSDLLYTSLIHHNSSYGESVVSFNWLLKMVFGINDLKTFNYPLLQLIFSTINSNGEQKQQTYDINKEMLAKLISALEDVEGM